MQLYGYNHPRRNTMKVLELVDEGMLNKDDLIQNLLGWLSDHDVGEFIHANYYDIVNDDEGDEDELGS